MSETLLSVRNLKKHFAVSGGIFSRVTRKLVLGSLASFEKYSEKPPGKE